METIIEHEGDVTAGDLKANDAYDLTLVRKSDGNYVLRLFMKLQFFFKADSPERWTMTEKKKFIAEWEKVIRRVWDNIPLRAIAGGKKMIKLSLAFKTQIGGIMLDHWEITVKKGLDTTFRSYVNVGWGNVMLTDRDNKLTVRFVKGARGTREYRQPTSAHEFGHMLGLPDEYGKKFGGKPNPNDADYRSVMNIGSQTRARHKNHFFNWLDKALAKHGIK